MSQKLEWTEADWLAPASVFRGAPFWAWNSRLEPQRLCRQIEHMRSAGMGGFFMHSRYGLKTAYLSQQWFECIWACVTKARALNMKAYLYDEDRWPSGTAGGSVTRGRGELSCHVMAAVRGGELPAELERLGCFAVRLDEAGRLGDLRPLEDPAQAESGETLISFGAGPMRPGAWFNDAGYLDTLSAEAVAEFIRITHQAYADRFGKDFGGVVGAIFTDEPNYSHAGLPHDAMAASGWMAELPWTPQLPRQFKIRRGYDLREHLPELFFPTADSFSSVRYDYHRTLTELFVENYSAQIGRWCRSHNIALTGHYLGEETFEYQTRCIGAAMAHYAHQQWPGVDVLMDQRDEITTVKQCTSVADQLGRPRVISELYGCTGWDWPLEGHKFVAGWQYVLGVNFRCPHLSLYSLAGGGKRDYPASIFPHSPWWKYYRVVEDHFARLGLMLTRGKPIRDVLVIHTIESAWGQYLPGAANEQVRRLSDAFSSLLLLLLGRHCDFDLGDESLLAEHGRAAAGKLKVARMEYRLVIVPPAVTLRASTVALLRRFQAGGGTVLFADRLPSRVDGRQAPPAGELAELIDRGIRCEGQDHLLAAIEAALSPNVSITEAGAEVQCVWAMLRRVKGGRLLFVQSCDRAAAHDVRVSVLGRRPVVAWDTVTGRRRRVESQAVGDHVEFGLELPPTGSALLSVGVPLRQASPARRGVRVVSAVEAPPPWKIDLLEPNSLPLDYCRFRIGQGELSQPMPVLLAEEKIRANFGLSPRANSGCQPWYLAATGRADSTRRGRCEMAFAFHVTDPPPELALAIERPEDFEIILNGRTVASRPTGWWVDEDIKAIDIRPAARAGDNELLLRFDYCSDMELEELRLTGPFGVRQLDRRRLPGRYSLAAPPAQLDAGSWVGQGLDFYGGAVMYRVDVPEPVREAAAAGRRVRIRLPQVRCTCAAVHVGGQTFVLPWPPMTADITDALAAGGGAGDHVGVEVIGGRKNILGPLHVPWVSWTGPEQFNVHNEHWTDEYQLTDHGLGAAPVFEICQ